MKNNERKIIEKMIWNNEIINRKMKNEENEIMKKIIIMKKMK